MTNREKLMSVIKNSGFKLSYIAEKLGISRAGLHKKISGNTEFRASEIVALQKILILSDKQRDDIFFAEKVE